MTREERLNWLEQIEKDIYVNSLESTLADDMKSCAIHSAIEALKAEPCGEAVSREAVLDALHVEGRSTKRFDCVIDIKNDIMALPSVTPTRPKGKWIYREDMLDYKCSECGRVIVTNRFENPYIRYPYCHCGAKMEGDEN